MGRQLPVKTLAKFSHLATYLAGAKGRVGQKRPLLKWGKLIKVKIRHAALALCIFQCSVPCACSSLVLLGFIRLYLRRAGSQFFIKMGTIRT